MSTPLAAIRLLALDVDGVLTDGRLWYSESAGEIKTFYAHDGAGLKQVMRNGIAVALITARQSPIVTRRAEELGIEHVFQGVTDKGRCLGGFLEEVGIKPAFSAYMGDDEADLPAFEIAGLRIAPANAVARVRDEADWCTQARGGEGAVREVCDRLLAARAADADSSSK
ncbi:MAG TPA: HAD hydrolase family protein [Gammaproteobacteria bacterium]|nr:HAD hydrolase family protein [Gammaproteobacteria bacterium]